MKLIDLLNVYASRGEVEDIPSELLDAIHADPSSLVHGTLVAFKNLGCEFNFEAEDPIDLREAKEKLINSSDMSERYVYALHCLRLQHHITSVLVQQILEKIGV